MASSSVTRIGPDVSDLEASVPQVQPKTPQKRPAAGEMKVWKEPNGAMKRENGTYAPSSYPLPSGNTREDH